MTNLSSYAIKCTAQHKFNCAEEDNVLYSTGAQACCTCSAVEQASTYVGMDKSALNVQYASHRIDFCL